MSNPSKDSIYHPELVRRALKGYPLGDPEQVFLRHNENLTYQVIDRANSAHYLLRLHVPRLEAFKGLQQDRRAIESELAWVAALRRDTDLPLQQPVAGRQGAFVVRIAHPITGEIIHCTLLTWITGRDFTQNDPRATHFARQLGELSALLHAHARAWEPPQPFMRPSYDLPELERALAGLREGVRLGTVAAGDFSQAEQAGAAILDLLRTLEHTPQTWGLAHADLLGNLIVTQTARGERLVPIDFSLSGFCFYLFDLGICLCNLKPAFRMPFLLGYGRSLSEAELHQVEAFILMIIFISAARQVANPEWKEWFSRRFPRIAQDYCPKLLRGERFVYDI